MELFRSLIRNRAPWVFTALLSLSFSLAAQADPIPDCLDDDGSVLPIDNDVAVYWKANTPNQYLDRSHVRGTFVKVTLDRKSHYQFMIQIGPKKTDLLEVIYNKEFGAYPTLAPGDEVEACGDFINSFAKAGSYQASPAGAIIHWVHSANPGSKHKSGFLVMDGQLVGSK